ncbi:trigger factor [Sphingosinicellaceae bacterium]|nr:trigger factor [Sphingosinicellaceae bacterium]
MRISETLNEGLKREYSVHIPAAALAEKIDARAVEVAKQVRMPGFRPGKVPLNLVKKMHGPALHGEVLQAAVNEGVQQLMAEHKLRPAMQPQVDLDENVAEGTDIDFKVAVEVLPTIETPNIEGLKLEKLVVEPTDADLDAALKRLSDQQKSFESAPATHVAVVGDAVLIDFLGTVDGVAFDGGKGEGMRVELGSGQLIPGFEDQLVGVKANDERTVKVTFPDDYNVAYLKGKDAEFAVTVNEVQTVKETVLDDEFAKALGLDTLDGLKEILKDQLTSELGQLTRTHMKRKLLDTLAAAHDFAVPESMVNAEFEQIWQQLEHEASHEEDQAAALEGLESEKPEYRRIAERRVRLGLLLSEIGQQGGVTVSPSEMNRLIAQEASRYPKERDQVIKYFQENAMAAAQLRAPLYEDKVVDYLIGKAEITERTVDRDTLTAEIESDDETPGGHVHGPDCDHDHGHDHSGHDHAGHDHGDHDHAPAAAAKPAKAPRAKKAKAVDPDAPVKDESEVFTDGPTLSDEPVAAVAAKPKRAKKAAEPAAE